MPDRKPDRKEEEPVQFKVVDRRMFTADGERRTDMEPEPEPSPAPSAPTAAVSATPASSLAASAPFVHAPSDAAPQPATAYAAPAASPPKAPSAQPPPAPSAPPQQPPGEGHPGAGPVQFEHLVMSLVTSAMMQMGLAARPGEMAPPPDLGAAQETIEILHILSQKTLGNLTREEDKLLSGSLHELRLAFIEMTRHLAGRIG